MIVEDLSPVSLVSVLIMVIAPLIVALLSKASWPGWVRSVILLAISAAVAVGNTFITDPDGWKPAVVIVNAVIAFIIGVASYFGLWKSTPLPDTLKDKGIADPPQSEPQDLFYDSVHRSIHFNEIAEPVDPGPTLGKIHWEGWPVEENPDIDSVPLTTNVDALLGELRDTNPAVYLPAEKHFRALLAQIGVH